MRKIIVLCYFQPFLQFGFLILEFSHIFVSRPKALYRIKNQIFIGRLNFVVLMV